MLSPLAKNAKEAALQQLPQKQYFGVVQIQPALSLANFCRPRALFRYPAKSSVFTEHRWQSLTASSHFAEDKRATGLSGTLVDSN
jgi:hypothetical protein